jgi:acetyltransferase-like isoleucine patch superfamily enzyme
MNRSGSLQTPDIAPATAGPRTELRGVRARPGRGTTVRRILLGGLLGLPLAAHSPASAQDLDWAQSGVADGSSGEALATDAQGNVFLAGSFRGSALTLGAGEAHETQLTGQPDGGTRFLAKYDRTGQLLWAQTLADALAIDVASAAVDSAGNAYLTGTVRGSTALGIGAHAATLTADADGDALIAKYDASGTLLWARSAGGPGWDFGSGIAVDARGILHVGGRFAQSATFGAGEPHETPLTARSPDRNGFLAAYDERGALLRAQYVSGSVAGVTLDAEGNQYLVGSFDESAQFGATRLTSAGGTDVFVAKYDCDGAALWARSSGGGGQDYGHSLAADRHGNVFVSGQFFYWAVFGAASPNEIELRGETPFNSPFFAKYDGAGTLQWVHTLGEAGDKVSAGVVKTDAAGSAYLAGDFIGEVVFGEGEPNETSLTTPGDYPGPRDVYLAKYSSSGSLAWARQARGPEKTDSAYGVAVDPAGGVYLTGYIDGSVTFGAGEPHETLLTGYALFLARFADRDAAHPDLDHDSIEDGRDNCPRLANPDQADTNRDGFGDACVPPHSVHSPTRIGADPLIGAGSRLARDVRLGARATLAENVQIERGARLGLQVRIDEGARIGPGAQIGGGARVGRGAVIGRGTRIGSSAIIEAGVTLGPDSVVGNGVRIGPDSAIGARASIALRSEILGPSVIGCDLVLGSHALVFPDVVIGRSASIGENAWIREGAVLGDFVTVVPNAHVPEGARIPDGAVVEGDGAQ